MLQYPNTNRKWQVLKVGNITCLTVVHPVENDLWCSVPARHNITSHFTLGLSCQTKIQNLRIISVDLTLCHLLPYKKLTEYFYWPLIRSFRSQRGYRASDPERHFGKCSDLFPCLEQDEKMSNCSFNCIYWVNTSWWWVRHRNPASGVL